MPTKSSAKYRVRVTAPLLIVLLATCLSVAGLTSGFPLAGGDSAAANVPNLPRSSRIPWQDGSYFLSGVNYPQYQYYGGDIGTLSSVDSDCIWYYSSSFDYAAIDADFAEMQAHGAHVVRWWLFGDGRGAPEFDINRMVTGFDATFFDHMDQAMEIAAHHNIYIIWTLWDFLAFEHGNWLCGGTGLSDAYDEAANMPPALRDAFLTHLKMAQAAPAGWLPGSSAPNDGPRCMINAGGHRNLVTDTSPGGAQDSFFNNALIPMLQRYANNRNIIGWEIMNEPEWALNASDYTGNQYPREPEPVDVGQMRSFFARFTQTVHIYAPGQYATVGAASLKFMGLGQFIPPGIWNGLGFDYYGVHYYGWMDSPFNNGSPMTIDYNTTQQELDAPVVIGEFPAYGGSAPVYLPSVRRSGTEASTLSLRYICTAYVPTNDPLCTRPYTATIAYDNPNGTLALSQTVVLPPYGGWTGPVPAGAGSFSGAARILSNGPVSAAITQTGILSAGEQAAYTGQDQANLTTWLPRITNQGTHRSRIAVQNTGLHTATVMIHYYDAAGTSVATDTLALTAHGSALIDPLLAGSPPGPPAGFQGSAIITGSRPLVATAYELDPQLGSDAYNGEGESYQNAVYLPLVRNWGANGNPTLYIQNPCCEPATAHDIVSYYNTAGTLVASQTLTLPPYGSAVLPQPAGLPGGFEGSVVITSSQIPAAVMRSVTTNGPTSTTELYAGTQNADQRLHFPIVHSLNSNGSGQDTSLAVQNVNASSPLTVLVMLNQNSGSMVFSNTIILPPQGQWVASVSGLPGVPAGFNGTGEVLWPWPNGWNQGFPLLATALDLDSVHSRGSAYRAVASHTVPGLFVPYSPDQLLEGIYAKHWAGALAWSFYDHGTGTWDDLQPAMAAFDAAHPADVRIGQTIYTPVPTPGNTGTATALAATNTPAYGNDATATAVAQQTSTPQPTCSTCNIIFTDVPPGSTFHRYILCLACRGIISGYPDGTFRPGNNVTRAQLAKIVSNAAGFSDPPGNQAYQDVAPGSTFYDFVQRLSSRGVIGGYACGGPGEPCVAPGNLPYFRPNSNATRGQISKIVVNTAVTALGWTLLNPPQRTFEDVAVGSTFYRYVETAYSHVLLSGYPCGGVGEPCVTPANRPYFRPNSNATRGQTSKIVANAFSPDCSTLASPR
ncbi:MAG: S-layer homology domain-containing protein [Chloroflexota bacterium]